MLDIFDFLTQFDIHQINNDEGFNDKQFAHNIATAQSPNFNVQNAQIVFVGIPEIRGTGNTNYYHGPNAIRKQLYRLHFWHGNIAMADVGNITLGKTLADTMAAAKTVIAELITMGKKVILLGGSHDCTLAQYYAYKQLGQPIEVTCIDALIDLLDSTPIRSENFLMEMLTEDPLAVRHYNHIGFQSYFTHPGLLQTMDNMRFDLFRLGQAKENIIDMEPVLRNSNMVTFDINAIKYADAPSTHQSPNGLTGEEACTLMRHAGMATNLSSIGIYGYNPATDINELTAKQIAQMVWYFIDGLYRGRAEAPLTETSLFNQYNCQLTQTESLFLQSKKTGRWWMQLPNKNFIPCTHTDYLVASQNEIPERWLRAQERDV
jgi:formiminoglutamase